MTIGFHETESEELARLREEDLYKKNLISSLLNRLAEQDAVLLECAVALTPAEEGETITKEYLGSLATHAREMAGKSPKVEGTEETPDKKEKASTRPKYEIIEVGNEFVVYRLTYDMTLNKTLPSGHEYVGRYSSLDEANEIAQA